MAEADKISALITLDNNCLQRFAGAYLRYGKEKLCRRILMAEGMAFFGESKNVEYKADVPQKLSGRIVHTGSSL